MTNQNHPRGGWKKARRAALRRIRNGLVGALGPLLVWVWTGTLRVRWHGKLTRRSGFPLGSTPGIYVFWHQRMLFYAGLYRKCGFHVVISHHGDGEMIARVVSRLGMHPVRGSTTRGGTRALLALLRSGDGSENIAITPDGPRGPLHRFQLGAVYLASRSGLAVYPTTVACERCARLKTWDRFMLPRPFSRTVVRIGDAVDVPAATEREGLEHARRKLERLLKELTESTDKDFDRFFTEGRKKKEVRVAEDDLRLLAE